MISRSVRDSHSDSSIKMNLTLHVKNFGPVSDANIHMKPLTILVGPDSSGKSYIAMLIHALISSHNVMPEFHTRDHFSKLFSKLYEELDSVLNDIKINVDSEDEISIPDSVVGTSQICTPVLSVMRY